MSKLKPLEAKAGAVIFLSGRTVHGGAKISGPGLKRRSYVCHYHRIDSNLDASNNRIELPSVPLK